ncbi:carbamoyltransferase C-terminal domain-containing protein [Kitasatospora sp. NPDC101176]|uniref:carbamoyltransferase C-terminal domain-containing protein n=1 Tax=Kitasatospora sp. NPDC101176 TaxID=3364099 RepID=UPI0038140627
MWILGLNAPPTGWHDTSACLVDEHGRVFAFCEEERVNRHRHSLHRAPSGAAEACLRQAGLTADDISVVAVGWDSEQLYPGRFANDREFLAEAVGLTLGSHLPEVVRVPHHQAHAASAFYASGFSEAGVLVVDGNGENESTSIWRFRNGEEPRCERTWGRTASLGYAYDAASTWLGFSFLNAGKTMGLAAYGRASEVDVEPLVSIDADGYRLAVAPLTGERDRATASDIKEEYDAVSRLWRAEYNRIAGGSAPTLPEAMIAQDARAVRVAYAAQRTIEEAVRHLAKMTRQITGIDSLCLSGGVSLNCSTNGTLDGPLYVPPVPHDAGVALGAAWTVRPPQEQTEPLSPYLGRDVTDGTVGSHGDRALDTTGLLSYQADADKVASLLIDGAVGAVAVGRAEIGPRALCHRSIIAVPNTKEIHSRVNSIKNREQWRPFAGVTHREYAEQLWEYQENLSRYMLGAARVTEEGHRVAPGVVHVDGTTRPQVIGDEAPFVAGVLDSLDAQGVPPVLLNTSFNDRGQPIVDLADDALAAFRSMDLDFLVLGDRLLQKKSKN